MRTIEEMSGAITLPPALRDLVCQFLLVFSRFEAALKHAGYRRQEGKRLVVDRHSFARENLPEVDGREALPLESLRYLLEQPPGLQVARDHWMEFVPEPARRAPVESEWLLEMVYRIRNNLFHGGKWPSHPERDAELLRAGLVALAYFVDLNDQVAEAYFGG